MNAEKRTNMQKIIDYLESVTGPQSYNAISAGTGISRDIIQQVVSKGIASGALDGYERVKMGTKTAPIVGRFSRKVAIVGLQRI